MTTDHAAVIRDRDVIVAELGGTIAGAIVLGEDDDGFAIENVAVHPSQQATAIGSADLGVVVPLPTSGYFGAMVRRKTRLAA